MSTNVQRDLQPAEFVFAGSLMIGRFPHIPIRFQLQADLRRALGITEADDADLMARKKAEKEGAIFEDEWAPSLAADPLAVLYVKAAAIGLCWPAALECPSLKDCRHDLIEYGGGVYDALVRLPEHRGRYQRATLDIRLAGNKLINAMVDEAIGLLVEEVSGEKNFSQGREATSTVG